MKSISFFHFLLLTIVFISCDSFSPGSYPYREEFVFEDQNIHEIIEVLTEFKIKNPKYSLPDNLEFRDDYTDERKLFYSFYFRYPERGLVIKSFVQKKENTVLGLVAICELNNLYNWKEINHDLKGSENEKVKEEFEKEVLDKLGVKYRRRTFWENIGFR